jgi:hypothetical protein
VQEATLSALEPYISGNIGTWRIRLLEDEKASPNENVLTLEKGSLKNGIVLLLREKESYLQEQRVENDPGTEWFNLLPAERTVASLAVKIQA